MSVTPARRLTTGVLLAGLLAGSSVSLAAFSSAPAAAQTAAPAPSAAGSVVLLSSSAYLDGSTGLYVVGEVRNDWNRVASGSEITVQLLDAAGNVLATEDAFTTRSQLAPGETSGFRRFFTKPAGYASHKVVGLTRDPSFRVANHNFDVTVTAAGRDRITGTVTNRNNAPADAPTVELLLRDAAGTVYDVDRGSVKGTGTDGDLLAGETVSFEAPRFSGEPFQDGGSVTGQAESLSAPSPYPTEVGITVLDKVVKAGEVGRIVGVVRGKGATGGVPTGTKVNVELLGREAGQSAYRVLRRATVEGTDSVRWELKPQRDIRYQLRVLPTATQLAATSGITLTQVAFNVVTTGTTSGGSAIFRGSVRPASAGQLVYLQQQAGSGWRNIRSARLNGSSLYSFTLASPPSGSVYRVLKPAVTGNQQGIGPAYRYTRTFFKTVEQ